MTLEIQDNPSQYSQMSPCLFLNLSGTFFSSLYLILDTSAISNLTSEF